MKTKDSWRNDYQRPLIGEMAIVVAAAETSINGWLFPSVRTQRPATHEPVETLFRDLSDRTHQPLGSRCSLRTFATEGWGY